MLFNSFLFFVIFIVANTRPAIAGPFDRKANPSNTNHQHGCSLEIPVEFLPAYRDVVDGNGKRKRVMVDARSTITVPTSEVALVLVDTWNGLDPQPDDQPSEILQNMREILALCRAHNITVIHAPNHPVVDKYEQYHQLKTELKSYDEASNYKKPYLRWGPWGNPIAEDAYQIRQDSRNTRKLSDQETSRSAILMSSVGSTTGTSCMVSINTKTVTNEGSKVKDLDISRFLLPLENEYVLQSHDEFRYVLWEKKISTILYIGGAINECMLQRPTGINALAGTDGKRFPFVIVVLEDCSLAMESPQLNAEEFKSVMLEYLKFKLAFVASSKALKFLL